MLSSRPCNKCSLHSRRQNIPRPDRLGGSSLAELGRSPCTAPCLSLSDRCSSFWSGQGDSLAARCSCMRFCCAERIQFLVRHTAVLGDSDPHWDRLLAVPVSLLVRQRIHQAHGVACSHSAQHSLCGRHTTAHKSELVQKTVTVSTFDQHSNKRQWAHLRIDCCRYIHAYRSLCIELHSVVDLKLGQKHRRYISLHLRLRCRSPACKFRTGRSLKYCYTVQPGLRKASRHGQLSPAGSKRHKNNSHNGHNARTGQGLQPDNAINAPSLPMHSYRTCPSYPAAQRGRTCG